MSNEPEVKHNLSRSVAWTALAAIVVIGGVLRFWQIGQKDLWLDESISAIAADVSLRETVTSVAKYDAHPPLYYLALNLTTRLTGRDEAGLRALSAVASIGCIVLTYALGAALLSRTAGLLVSGLMAMSSFQLYFAQEARLYAFVTLLVLGNTYVFVRILKSRRTTPGAVWPWMVAYAVLTAAALYTYYYAVFMIATHAAVFCVLWFCARFRPGADEERWLLTARRAEALWPMFLAAMVLGGILFAAAWGGILLDRVGEMGQVTSRPYGPYEVVAALRQFLTGMVFDRAAGRLDWFTLASFTAVALLPLAGALYAARRTPGVALVLLLSTLLPFAGVALVARPHVFEAKHVAFVAPMLLLMIGAGWSRSRMLVGVFAVLLLALNAGMNCIYFRPDYQKEPWRAVAEKIEAGARRGDVIVLSPAHTVHALRRYYQGELPMVLATGVDSLRSLGAMTPQRIWLVEHMSAVTTPARSIAEWLMAQAGPAGRIPRAETFDGFSTFPTTIRVRCFPYKPADGR